MISMNKKTDKYRSSGFTLVEIIVVVVIISIAALIAIPMLSSAAGMQIRSAANIIAADMEYAKSMAISRQKSYSVIFDVNNNKYQIESGGNVISHPVNASGNFIVSFASDSRLDRVDISAVDFNSDLTVTFDYLGSPSDVGGSPLLNSGQVTLEADGITVKVTVEPVTGYVTVE